MVWNSQIHMDIIEGLLAQVVHMIEKLIMIRWHESTDQSGHFLEDWQHASWWQGQHFYRGTDTARRGSGERQCAAARIQSEWQHASWWQSQRCREGIEAARWSGSERRSAAAETYDNFRKNPGAPWTVGHGDTTTTRGEKECDGELWSSDAKRIFDG